MKIGILKTDDVNPGLVEEFGEYPLMFANLLRAVDPALEFVTYEVQHEHYPEDIDEVDAYLMTGSKSSVYEDKPWLHRLKEFVQELNKRRKKLVGICFGHQMVAHSLGGKTEKSEKGWGVGVHTVQMTEQGQAFADKGQPVRLLVSHQDQVTTPVPGANIMASSEFCPIAMCQIDNHILTFQGHPEFVAAYSRNLLDLRRDNYSPELYQQAMASLSTDTDHHLVAQWIVNFLRNES